MRTLTTMPGSAEIKRVTGAQYMVMDSDVPVVESGGAKDFFYPNDTYPPAKVDRVLHDGDEVQLGGAVLVAHKTPGHTRGCTTWTMRATQQGKLVNVVIVGSWNVNPGYRLVSRLGKPASYPGIADDYRKTFAVLKGLPCDIFLGAHGQYFDMLAKLERANADVRQKVWIDPEGYQKAVAEKEQEFEAELLRQERTEVGPTLPRALGKDHGGSVDSWVRAVGRTPSGPPLGLRRSLRERLCIKLRGRTVAHGGGQV